MIIVFEFCFPIDVIHPARPRSDAGLLTVEFRKDVPLQQLFHLSLQAFVLLKSFLNCAYCIHQSLFDPPINLLLGLNLPSKLIEVLHRKFEELLQMIRRLILHYFGLGI